MRLLLLVVLMGCSHVKVKWGPWVVEKPTISKDGAVRHRKCRSKDMGEYTQYECIDEVEFPSTSVP